MREHPWHLRRPTHEHHQWFQKLLDLHQITANWLRDMDLDQNSLPHQLSRVSNPTLQSGLFLLESLSHTNVPAQLESLLDHSHPEELLKKLEQTIWAVQSWTLRSVLEKTPDLEADAVRNLLEQSSWKTGRACAGSRWPTFQFSPNRPLSSLLTSLLDSPMTSNSPKNTFLVHRATHQSVSLELLACPHHSPYLEVEPIADALCHLHSVYMRGFLYALNPKLRMERSENPVSGRCILDWSVHRPVSPEASAHWVDSASLS